MLPTWRNFSDSVTCARNAKEMRRINRNKI
jgi:hypothetical protein